MKYVWHSYYIAKEVKGQYKHTFTGDIILRLDVILATKEEMIYLT